MMDIVVGWSNKVWSKYISHSIYHTPITQQISLKLVEMSEIMENLMSFVKDELINMTQAWNMNSLK